MIYKTLFTLVLCVAFLVPHSVYAWFPELPKLPDLNITLPTPTPTPTPTINFKYIPPLKTIPELELPNSTNTPTQSPIPSNTVAPMITATPSMGTTNAPTPTAYLQESTQTGIATSSINQALSTKDIILFSLIGVIIILLIGQPLWTKIKVWIHKKTE